MKVLLLGANGYMGPHLVKVLEKFYQLRITDIMPIESEHETMVVDVTDLGQVMEATEGMDAIINCSVLRHDRKLAFDVSARGSYNVMRSAVNHKIQRIIQTGGVKTVFTMEELYEAVNKYLDSPASDSNGRKRIVANETGPFKGNASEIIGNHILSLVCSN